ncbi:MAG: phage tail tube protein, partial [Rhodospirillaceae bacterium]
TGTFSTAGSTITGTGVDTGMTNYDTIRYTDGSTVLGYHKMNTIASGVLTVTPAPSALTGGGNEEVEAGARITAGTTFRSFNIEREYTDLTSEFALYRGMAPQTLSLSMTPESIITGSIGFIGKDETTTTSTLGDGSPTDPGSGNTSFNAIDHIYAIWEANAVTAVRQFDMSLNNNLFPRLELGTLGAVSIGKGSIDLSGSIQLTYDSTSEAFFAKLLSQAETSLQVILVDASGNAYSIDIPAIKLSDGKRVAGGLNQDVIADISWAAKVESTESEMLRMQRWAV